MSFTLNGKTASELDVKLKSDYQEPGAPDIRKREAEIPGKAGRYDFGDEYDTRTFELPLVTLNTTKKAEVQAVIRNLTNELTDKYGRPQTVNLSFDKEPDLHYRVKLSESYGITRHPAHFGEFTLTLVATLPYALGNSETVTKNVTSSPATITVENSGDVETPVKITIENTGSTTINSFDLSTTGE